MQTRQQIRHVIEKAKFAYVDDILHMLVRSKIPKRSKNIDLGFVEMTRFSDGRLLRIQIQDLLDAEVSEDLWDLKDGMTIQFLFSEPVKLPKR